MMVLISYDISTESRGGASRLRKVAKCCQDYGIRVQYSVFECLITPAQFEEIKAKLKKEINPASDSIRFYLLGKKWDTKIETLGKEKIYELDQPLIL